MNDAKPLDAAREIWAWAWVRCQNLYTDREPPFLTTGNAPDDLPAVSWIEERLAQVRADERERAARILDENVSCPDRSCERCGALRVNAEAIRRGTEPAEEEAANG